MRKWSKRAPQYRDADHRSDRNDEPDVADHFGYRTGVRPVYMRRRKVNPSDKDVKVTFVDEVGDSWEEYNVFHHKFLVWLEANGYDVAKVKNMPQEELDALVAKSPYHKATANDIDWVSKVKLQGAIQKWV